MDKTRYISALTSCFALRDECAQKLASSSSFALLDGWDQVQSYSLSITFALVLALASKSSLGTWVDETALFFLHHHIQWVVMHNNATKFLFFSFFGEPLPYPYLLHCILLFHDWNILCISALLLLLGAQLYSTSSIAFMAL